MINKIGVENFRVFKEYTEFEIRPITLLTGPNNSGKSSFTKLLLLLQNGREQLDFKKGRHNLESFDKVLNWDYGEEELIIRMNCPIPILRSYDIEYVFATDGNLEEISFGNQEETLMKFRHTTREANETEILSETSIVVSLELEFSLIKFLDVLYKYIDLMAFSDSPNNSLFKNLVGEKDYLLYHIFINGEDCTDIYKNEILRIQNEPFIDNQKDIFLSYHQHHTVFKDYVFSRFTASFISCISSIESDLYNRFDAVIAENNKTKKNFQIKKSPLGNLLFGNLKFETPNDEIERKYGSIIHQIYNLDEIIEENLKQLDFISATRGSQKRVLQNFSDNEIDKIIVDYYEYKDKKIPFLQEVFKLLKIEGNLIIDRFQNSISIVYLQTKKGKIALSDVGFGFSQIIPVILKIIMTPGTLIIEEPEANLHPALQSKLADILVTAISWFPEKSFILETHSEYLIRKLQYLTAKKKISPEDSVIYYFNSDEFVTHEEPKVKKIEITETGNLTESFGPGFYDEATRLQFDLMKVKKEQKN